MQFPDTLNELTKKSVTKPLKMSSRYLIGKLYGMRSHLVKVEVPIAALEAPSCRSYMYKQQQALLHNTSNPVQD